MGKLRHRWGHGPTSSLTYCSPMGIQLCPQCPAPDSQCPPSCKTHETLTDLSLLISSHKYTHVCMCTHIHTVYMYTCTHMYIYGLMCIYTHYICIHVYIHTHIPTCVHMLDIINYLQALLQSTRLSGFACAYTLQPSPVQQSRLPHLGVEI